jgi:hypothetical protein
MRARSLGLRIAEVGARPLESQDRVDERYLFGRLERMASERLPFPLVTISGNINLRDWGDARVHLTDFGRDVVEGRACNHPANPIDDWVCGVHLSSVTGNLWFYDGESVTRGV